MLVLEARACGTRVVTTDIPELREAGGQDAVYTTATEESLREAILKALASPRPNLLTLRNHSWEQSASAMVKVFRQLASLNANTNHAASVKCN
jgi:glycosyltransferase involved in cell wall biosynthesis